MKRLFSVVLILVLGAADFRAQTIDTSTAPAAAPSSVPPKAKRKRRAPRPAGDPTAAPNPDPSEGTLAIQKIPPEMEKKPVEQPWPLRLILHPRPRGMFLSLPVVDTDPNRGVTYGVMPIWVIQGKTTDRIVHIHAPSITRNAIFKINATYRYYYYPTKDSTLTLRASYVKVVDRELFGEYEDFHFLDLDLLAKFRLQYNADGSGRFFGAGPDSAKSAESNYVDRDLETSGLIGLPLYPKSDWNIILSHRLTGQKISNGPIKSLPGIDANFPGTTSAHYHQDSFARLAIQYDTRDSPVTTSQGLFADFSAGTSQRAFESEYTYRRYGADLRYFRPQAGGGRFVTATRLKYDQVIGDGVPFWLLPQLGGKYIHRAYGEGRYLDQGLMVGTIEERITAVQIETAGVQTKFEVAPFLGLGEVFSRPNRMARRYARPVYGAAVRAVAPPQVVGSIDFGVGQEGVAIFMDIDYPF